MKIYSHDFKVEYKQDKSPLTQADITAHQIITSGLEPGGLPVLSEEGADIPFSVRSKWQQFWMVDPLDGTKEFVNRNGDFTVNIALIVGNLPVAGVIYAPVPDMMYFSLPGYGAFRIPGDKLKTTNFVSIDQIIQSSDKLPCKHPENNFVVVASRSHINQETKAFIDEISKSKSELTFLSKGSSLKFCAMAEGTADLYPRMGPTMEWDTAAGHAIATQAGCNVINPVSGTPLIYNKESLLNPWFVVAKNCC